MAGSCKGQMRTSPRRAQGHRSSRVEGTVGSCEKSPWAYGVRADLAWPRLSQALKPRDSGENRMEQSRLWQLEQVCIGRGRVGRAGQGCTKRAHPVV